jgi:Ca2+-binding RTX toxin-like protein
MLIVYSNTFEDENASTPVGLYNGVSGTGQERTLERVTEDGNTYVRSSTGQDPRGLDYWWLDSNHYRLDAGFLYVTAEEYFASWKDRPGPMGPATAIADLRGARYSFDIKIDIEGMNQFHRLGLLFGAKDSSIDPAEGQKVHYLNSAVRMERLAPPGEWTNIQVDFSVDDSQWLGLDGAWYIENRYSLSDSIGTALLSGNPIALGVLLYRGLNYWEPITGSISFDNIQLQLPDFYGFGGDETFEGGSDRDLIYGDGGSDVLAGGDGDDEIYGGGGDDRLTGGLGADRLKGGPGADTFVFAGPADSSSFGWDILYGFDFAADALEFPFALGETRSGTAAGLSIDSFEADLAQSLEGLLTPYGAVFLNVAGGDYAGRSFLVVDADGDGVHLAGQDFVIEIALNNAPAGEDRWLFFLEDAAHAFKPSDFGFSDADGDNLQAVIVVSLPAAGELTLNGLAVVAGQAVAAAEIGNLVFTPAPNADISHYATLSFQVVDDGGSANGGSDLDPTPNTLTFHVRAVNDAPTVAIGDSFDAVEQVPLDLKGSLRIADVDAGSGVMSATLSVASGILSVAAGGSGATVAASEPGSSIAITGTLQQINALLGTDAASAVTFTADSDAPPAVVMLTLTVDDRGGAGLGGARTGSGSAAIRIAQRDDAPVLAAPDAQSGTEDLDLVFSAAGGNAIVIEDPDGGTPIVTLAVSNGTLTLIRTEGLELVAGANGSPTVSYWGSVAALNAALDGLVYRGNLNYQGDDTLSLTVEDGAGSDVRSIRISLGRDGNIEGTAGNDMLDGTDGPDRMVGGAGDDSYSVNHAGDVVVELADEGTDTVRTALGSRSDYAQMYVLPENVENLTGISAEAQGVYGNALNNLVTTGAGGDLIVMHDGGDDIVEAGGGNDFIHFGNALTADDQVDGGAGFDTVGLLGSYAITLAATSLTSVEKLAFYSNGDTTGATANNYDVTMHDANVASGESMMVVAQSLLAHETLVFDGSAESDGRFNVRGGRGDDTIRTGAGNDQLYGNLGADLLFGGAGNDIFEYYSALESTAAHWDTILDFTRGDKINLIAIDADGKAENGNQSFLFIGAQAFSGQARELRVSQVAEGGWIVEGDLDGDGSAELVIAVTVSDGHSLTADAFWL